MAYQSPPLAPRVPHDVIVTAVYGVTAVPNDQYVVIVVACFARQGIQDSSAVMDENRLTRIDACDQRTIVELGDYLCFVLRCHRLNAHYFNGGLRFVSTFACRSCVGVRCIVADFVTFNIIQAVRGSAVGSTAVGLAVYTFLS